MQYVLSRSTYALQAFRHTIAIVTSLVLAVYHWVPSAYGEVKTSHTMRTGGKNCDDFSFPQLHPTYRANLLQTSTIYLQPADDERGSAFLIDKENGIFLTAGHVVESQLQREPKDRTPIEGYNLRLLGQKPIKLSVVEGVLDKPDRDRSFYRHDKDIALLKAENPDELSGFQALNLSFRSPPTGEEVIFAGYSESNAREAVAGLSAPKNLIYPGKAARNVHLLDTSVDVGDSGGPVFMAKTGIVVGFVVGHKDGKRAVIHSIKRYDEFIIKHLLPRIRSDLHKTILDSSAASTQRLAERLKPILYGPYAGNLHLIHAIAWMNEEKALETIPDDTIDCPLHKAIDDRYLDRWGLPVVIEIGRRNKTPFPTLLSQRAAQYDKQGDRELSGYYHDLASLEFKRKLESIIRSKANSSVIASAWNSSGKVSQYEFLQDDSLKFRYAFDSFESSMALATVAEPATDLNVDAQSDGAQKSDRLAALLHDYASAILAANERLSRPSIPIEAAVSASAMASLVARSKNWKSRSLDTYATALARSNNWLASQHAWSTIWQNGIKNNRVITEFQWANQNHTNTQTNKLETVRALDTGIALSDSDIAGSILKLGEQNYFTRQTLHETGDLLSPKLGPPHLFEPMING